MMFHSACLQPPSIQLDTRELFAIFITEGMELFSGDGHFKTGNNGPCFFFFVFLSQAEWLSLMNPDPVRVVSAVTGRPVCFERSLEQSDCEVGLVGLSFKIRPLHHLALHPAVTQSIHVPLPLNVFLANSCLPLSCPLSPSIVLYLPLLSSLSHSLFCSLTHISHLFPPTWG